MNKFFEGFKSHSENLATLVNVILLSVVYILGVGITSLAARILNKRFIEKDIPKRTYWETLNLSKKRVEEYYKQY